MDYGLKGKVVLITGSTGGIGQALCRAFAAEGCKLAISSTSQDKLDAFVPTLDIASENLRTFIADVTHEDEVKAFVDGAYAAFGRVIEGIEAVDHIAALQTDYADRPLEYPVMERVTVETFGTEYKPERSAR